MKNLAKLYVLIAVIVFTFCVSIKGHTPAAWALKGVTLIVHNAPRLAGN